jgi:hypothetical protein
MGAGLRAVVHTQREPDYKTNAKHIAEFCLIYFICVQVRTRAVTAVSIALGYGLDDRGSRVRFPAGAWNFSLHCRVQTGSWAHPASYPMGNRVSFTGCKAAGS